MFESLTYIDHKTSSCDLLACNQFPARRHVEVNIRGRVEQRPFSFGVVCRRFTVTSHQVDREGCRQRPLAIELANEVESIV